MQTTEKWQYEDETEAEGENEHSFKDNVINRLQNLHNDRLLGSPCIPPNPTSPKAMCFPPG